MRSIPKPEGSFWSDDQWKAIASAGEDMLVAAAAGSGKTAVLVERIIRKISDENAGFSVDRLLVATFTKAAASEMRERIRDALETALEEQPESDHLRRQLSLLGRASITTLHSFCMEIIRRYYQQIPLDPGFRILNEYEAELMRQELLMDLFEQKYSEEGEGSTFRRLVDWFSGERNDDAMYRLVQKLYDFSRSHSWPSYWLDEMAASFRVNSVEELSQSAWVKSIMRDAELALGGAVRLLEQALDIAKEPEGPAAYAETFSSDLEMVQELLTRVKSGAWDELYDIFHQSQFGKLKAVRKGQADPALQERAKERREAAKKTVTELKTAMFGRAPEQFLEEMQKAAPLMEELSSVVNRFADIFAEEKKARGVVDFSDLEHYALHILRHSDSTPEKSLPSDAAIEYQQQFDEVLLDEYQDTNTVQEDIVSLISRKGPGNRFMVGDVKQSIYRFRLAEPGLFLDKYRRYDAEGEGEGLRIDLARNFRSRLEVVDAVNMLFRQIMNAGVAEIEYDDAAALSYGASFPEIPEDGRYTPELVLIDRAGAGTPEQAEAEGEDGAASEEMEQLEMETAELEARVIASRIHEMVGNTGTPLPVYDKNTKEMRPARYGDIVILLRSAQLWTPLIMEQLKREGIPVIGDQNKGFFQATEIEIMLSLLQVVDNPQQDIPLASVLRSPIVGLDEEELAVIRLAGKQLSFYDAMRKTIEDSRMETDQVTKPSGVSNIDQDAEQFEAQMALELGLREASATMEVMELGGITLHDGVTSDEHTDAPGTLEFKANLLRKLSAFSDLLEEWRSEARRGSLSELIWRIYRDTGYLDWVSGLPGGVQRSRNLKALYDRAKQYENSTANRGLFRFLTFIARLRDNGGDLGAVGIAADTEGSVRIMTIHRSKGLEFPIVFVAGMSKMFNQQDLNAPFMMHKELGFGPRFVDEENRVSYPTLASLAIRRRAHAELLAEEMRVLYVALTRPKEKMILIGTVKDVVQKAMNWSQIKNHHALLLPETLLASGRSYLDWVGPALFRHPDAWHLRALASLGDEEDMSSSSSDSFSQDQSRWRISVLSGESVSSLNFAVSEVSDEVNEDRQYFTKALMDMQRVQTPSTQEDDSIKTEIDGVLSWSYPYMASAQTAASTSVTEMKALLAMQEHPPLGLLEQKAFQEEQGRLAVDDEFTLHLRRPKFMEESTITGTERGTVYHTVMQHVPAEAGLTVSMVQDTLASLVERHILLPYQAEAIDAVQIARFFESEPGIALAEAEKTGWVRREMPFSYGLPADETLLDFHSADVLEEEGRMESSILHEETVLIQGIVDCLFEVNGKRILLDYKTDKVLEHRGGIETLAKGYQFQLDLYARALHDILGYEIDEKWLYFFDADTAVKL
ncbi:helicase-exonuclease AddAB subunit AddA [Paenibacillus sp. Marseille-Q4541]|uniref:helicase-exonuclease AddAB subunit AddA n=1 Tax=Paenibacillus sp. Marseille-Q4541 TaxID=2831522 RepID=UPI001BAE2047|nr:helicase-exonuclease AddAB subunit AddA [Paenibacillus sp. Marseille-Q4541]